MPFLPELALPQPMTIGFVQESDFLSFTTQHLLTKGCSFQEVILFSTLAPLANSVRLIIPIKNILSQALAPLLRGTGGKHQIILVLATQRPISCKENIPSMDVNWGLQ